MTHARQTLLHSLDRRRLERTTWRAWFFNVVLVGVVWGWADEPTVHWDPAGDARAILTDTGADGPIDVDAHRLPDLLSITLGGWKPQQPDRDLYDGNWKSSGSKRFLRIDLTFNGLANPPGLLDFDGGEFDPFRFGPHPVFGFVELDADNHSDTGGELNFPGHRYIANAARWGGIPYEISPDLKPRFARGGSDVDADCRTSPWIHRSGEEFHLALFGREYRNHIVLSGDQGDTFEAGEEWLLEGVWLHRAHGFEPYSFAEGSDTGVYDPPSVLRWSHDLQSDRTTVILVFPLANDAARAMRGDGDEEPNDGNPFNQASITEALADLQFSADVCVQFGCDECSDLILGWASQDFENYLDPTLWEVSAIFCSSYLQRQDNFFVWSDLWPNVVRGDVDGDGDVGPEDQSARAEFIETHDGGPDDADGQVDGGVTLRDFAFNFSVFDRNYDGRVDSADDVPSLPGDMNGDGEINLADWPSFVVCFQGPNQPAPVGCERADFDQDDDVDLNDVGRFQTVFMGE